MTQYKATLFDYDKIIAAESLDEHVVCLDDRELRLLLALLEPARWKTRWYNGDVDKDLLEEFVDGIAAKLSGGCMPINVPLTYIRLSSNCDLIYSWHPEGVNPDVLPEEDWQVAARREELMNCLCCTSPMVAINDKCNTAWVMAANLLFELAFFYQYDYDNSPFDSKYAFLFAFRDAYPEKLFSRMPAGSALSVANMYEAPELLTLEIFASSGAQTKLAEIFYCAMSEEGWASWLSLRILVLHWLEILEFWIGDIYDIMHKFLEIVPDDEFDRLALLAETTDSGGSCAGFGCGADLTPLALFVCDGYEGSIETITDALADGTTGHYKAVLGWYDTSEPDTATHVCIGGAPVGEVETDLCFIIENINVVVGPTPDGYKAGGIGGGFTGCDYEDHNSADINDTENVSAVRVRWSHSAETAIEIEFDLRRDV